MQDKWGQYVYVIYISSDIYKYVQCCLTKTNTFLSVMEPSTNQQFYMSTRYKIRVLFPNFGKNTHTETEIEQIET